MKQKLIDKDALIAEITREEKHYLSSTDYSLGWNHAMEYIKNYLDSMQEEPSLSNKQSVDEAMAEIERKTKLFTEANKGKTSEEILAEMRGEEPVSEELKVELEKYIKDHFTIDTEQLDRFGIEEKDYMYSMDKSDMLALVEHFINWHKTKEESVSEGLEEAMQHNAPNNIGIDDLLYWRNGFITGSKWQKGHLWKPADGDDLPEIDREVIALLDNGKVVYAHRPPEHWDGKDIVTGKVTRYYPKTYDKGGWNIPDVKYWLDCSMPNLGED